MRCPLNLLYQRRNDHILSICTVHRTVIIANNIQPLVRDQGIAVSREDIANCKKLSQKKNVFKILSKSLAPSIHGHEYVKQAILCMLLGGVEKVLPNGTRLRG